MGLTRNIWVIPVTLALASCGYQSDLTRLPPDTKMSTKEQKEIKADERREVRRGLTVPSSINPRRVDELRVQLKERPLDPFGLPPEGADVEQVAPYPGEEEPDAGNPLTKPLADPGR